VEVRVKVQSSVRSMGALASRVLAVGVLAIVLATSGAVSGVAEAQAHTKAQTRAAHAARHKRQRVKAAAARKRRLARQRRIAAARRARARSIGVSSVASTGWRTAKASWYGPGFYGHGMAGGGILKKSSRIVAHKTLPFGTLVEFSHDGKTIVVPVRDRGPYVSGREFDLGPGTARALGMYHTGTLSYRILGR
ncbi:MAG: septal ring lytic transglycosylase RlpA family protein, partial [Coriobacteriia bacterium]|nr:septal ring lytic transglycosylase RlpA family protein [Coriobacteriia bacterium]